ncbi:MAG: hypothetical protein SGILL_006890, partial [Bacillariaceae sp.]
TTTRSLVVIGMIMGTFQLCQGQQWMRRKRVSPLLAIDDFDQPLSSVLEKDEYRIMDRNLGIGGYHRPNNKSEKGDKADKESKSDKSSKSSKSSKRQRSMDSFDFMSMTFCMSMDPTPTPPNPPPVPSPTPPAPTPPAPTPTPPGPTPTSPPQPSPTDAPVPAPSNAPDGGCSSRPREEAMVDTLSGVTDPATLNNPSTPQGMAFRWLMDTDPAQVDPCTYPT